MGRKKTAGEQFEHDDPKVAVAAVVQKPEELIAEEQAAAKSAKFPANLKDSFGLLAKLNSEPVSSYEEWKAKQPALRALKKHIHQLQQGLPTIPTTSQDPGPSWADQLKRFESVQLEQLAVTNPAVKSLLDENAALKKQISDLTKKHEINL